MWQKFIWINFSIINRMSTSLLRILAIEVLPSTSNLTYPHYPQLWSYCGVTVVYNLLDFCYVCLALSSADLFGITFLFRLVAFESPFSCLAQTYITEKLSLTPPVSKLILSDPFVFFLKLNCNYIFNVSFFPIE
jgi:hypothetical protein